MPAATADEAIDRALAAYAQLTERAEEIEDEWSYVNDLSSAWRERLELAAGARTGAPLDPAVDAAIDRLIDEVDRITDPHRAIDWLSTFPQVALLALGRDAVRFQDAARDGRAIVYAGIQADPLVKRTATLLADATPAQRVLARAAMNGETTDVGRLARDVPHAVRRLRPSRRRAGALRGDPRAPAWRSPTGASRSAASSAARSSRS